MAVLVTRQVLLRWSIRLLLLCINISAMGVKPVCSRGTFILRKQKDNEVIFEGERITLECRAPKDVSNPQFKLLDAQNNVVVDQDFRFYADGHFGYPDSNGGGANFEISINSVSQNRYLCEISGDDGVLSTDEVSLNVFHRDSPQCFLNSSASVRVGEVFELSCYQEVGIVPNSNFRWRQILRDGTVNEQLPTEYSGLINLFKRKLSTRIITSLNDEGSEFECVLINSGLQKTCKTGVISIQQNQEVELTISPNRGFSLDRGDSQVFICTSSDPRYIVSWVEETGYQNTDADVWFFESLASVSIPTDTTIMNGLVLTFVCGATFEGNTYSETLLVTINFASSLNPLSTTITPTTTKTTTQPTQLMLTFTPPTVPPLDRGDMVEVECSPSVEYYEILWIVPTTVSERDAELDNRGGTLHIHIPIDTTLMSGAALTFVCLASSSGVMFNRQLTLNVVFTSTTNSPSPITTPPSTPTFPPSYTSYNFMTSPMDGNMTTTNPDEEPDTNGSNDSDGEINTAQNSGGIDYTIFIVIAGVVMVILVAIIVIILIAIHKTKQADQLNQGKRKFQNATYDSNFIEIDDDEINDDSRDWRGSTVI